MTVFKILFVFLYFWTFELFSYPTKPNYISRTFSSTDGLAHNIVSSITQDKKGYLWIATYGGLNRFDGREFRNYTMVNGLVFDAVRSVYADNEDKIWIGTELGLSIAENGEILTDEKSSSITKNFVGLHIRAINSLEDKTILIGTAKGLFSVKGSQVQKISTLPSTPITHIFKDSNQIIWVGTKENGLFKLDKDLKVKSGAIDEEIISISEDETNQNILVSYKKTGIVAYDYNVNKLITRTQELISKFNPKDRYLICKSGIDKKLVFLSQVKKSYFYNIDHYEIYDTENGNTCFVDREGDIWIGTYGSGLTEYFKRKAVSFSAIDGLFDPGIRFIFKDSKNTLWLGTQNNLAQFKEDKFRSLPKEEIAMDRVRAILQDQKGRVWFGTGSGLFYYENKFTELKNKKNESLDIYSLDEFENSIFVLEQGKYVKKIFLSPIKDRKSVSIEESDRPEVFWKIITSLDKKHLYLQSSERILKYDENSNKFFTVIKKENANNLKKIQAFVPITEKHMILGYDKLVILKDGVAKELTEQNGLPSGQIVSLAVDSDQSVWIGTSKGLAHYHDGEITSYTKNDGLAGDFCHFNSIFLDEESVYVGTSEGLSIVQKKNLIKNSLKPQVYFTSVKTNKDRTLYELNRLKFEHDENTISLNASSLSFISPNRNKYRFIFM